ncbi:CLUMA_CG014041, isoform A [Clunio marinus]|uniref:CLUMA_CG014041, isoform A n=1 Tax=Clunio marinus TaxID=568069 RepID=A0A1J1IKN2_9DIPT|nr:CLUMA_CG014041, isoform A [Clunio marinus]
MNRLMPKVLIFGTFFGSCAIIGLLLSALVTNSWIVSGVSYISQKTNVTEKTKWGSIQFGLFNYQKALNHGYGVRHEPPYSVLEIIKKEEQFTDYWLWLSTALGTGFALFASAIAAVASVVTTIKTKGGMTWLKFSNVITGCGQLVAIICWSVQFFYYFNHNVLLSEEKQRWTSEGQTKFGFSFYFLVFSFLAVIVNLILLTFSVRMENSNKSSEPINEKEGNSIMLY